MSIDTVRKVLNAPERIWLVYGDNEWDVDHADLDPEDVCWSSQREFPADVEYVNVAEVERLTAERGGLREALARVDGSNTWAEARHIARAALAALPENGGTE